MMVQATVYKISPYLLAINFSFVEVVYENVLRARRRVVKTLKIALCYIFIGD